MAVKLISCKIYLLIVCRCVCLGGSVYVWVQLPKKAIRKSWRTCYCETPNVGTRINLRSFARAVCIPNHWAISETIPLCEILKSINSFITGTTSRKGWREVMFFFVTFKEQGYQGTKRYEKNDFFSSPRDSMARQGLSFRPGRTRSKACLLKDSGSLGNFPLYFTAHFRSRNKHLLYMFSWFICKNFLSSG